MGDGTPQCRQSRRADRPAQAEADDESECLGCGTTNLRAGEVLCEECQGRSEPTHGRSEVDSERLSSEEQDHFQQYEQRF